MPFIIVASAIFFNLINAGLNGYYLARFETYSETAFSDWKFYLGITFFLTGLIINQISDHKLIHLRKPNETGYKIPKGFLFKYVSCPNLFGELLQWGGFAIMAWNLPALTFLVWTCANLIPRATKHHQWYKSQFSDYPAERKALFPWLF